MRAYRSLASAVVVAVSLVFPTMVAAQTSEGGSTPAAVVPLPRGEGGRQPLEGTPWRLSAYRWQGTEREPGPEVAASMRLVAGALEASGGCSRIKGDYDTIGATIRFDLRGLKEPDCAEQTTLVQRGMVDGLRRASSWEVIPGPTAEADELVVLNAARMPVLRFRLDDIDELERADWLLHSYTVDGVETAASGEQTSVFSFRPQQSAAARRRSSGQLTGSTGCNGIVTEYFRQADVLSFGELQLTDAPCTAGLAAQQQAITVVLDATSLSLELPHDELHLTSADTGERLRFTSRQPLEGSTWSLQPGPWMARPAGAITLRLDDGLVSGEGPCGPYTGGYRTDGVFITFDELRGASVEGCDAQRAENALVGGLRRAVLLERDGSVLTLLDPAGEVTLSFQRPAGP